MATNYMYKMKVHVNQSKADLLAETQCNDVDNQFVL